jgi:taurine dioxygenase
MSLATHESMSTKASDAVRLDVVPLTKHIGAEIRGIDLRDKPDEATVKAIYQAWLDHLVLIFPEQKLSQED